MKTLLALCFAVASFATFVPASANAETVIVERSHRRHHYHRAYHRPYHRHSHVTVVHER